jgi:hypothetical protein
MATPEQIYEALKAADAAGNTADAQKLAAAYVAATGGRGNTPTAVSTPAPSAAPSTASTEVAATPPSGSIILEGAFFGAISLLLMLPLLWPAMRALGRIVRPARKQKESALLNNAFFRLWSVRLGLFGVGLGFAPGSLAFTADGVRIGRALGLAIGFALMGLVVGGVIDLLKYKTGKAVVNSEGAAMDTKTRWFIGSIWTAILLFLGWYLKGNESSVAHFFSYVFFFFAAASVMYMIKGDGNKTGDYPASQSPPAPVTGTYRQVGEQAASRNVAPARQSPDVDEDAIYATIANELKTGATKEGLWTRAFAECDGDENRTKALYIKRRAETLIAEERKRVADERKRVEALVAAERKRVADERKMLVLGPPLRRR